MYEQGSNKAMAKVKVTYPLALIDRMARFGIFERIEGRIQACAPGTHIPPLAKVSSRPFFNVAAPATSIAASLQNAGFTTLLEGDTVVIKPTVEC